MNFKIINCKETYRGGAFRVQQVLIEFPDGKQRTYDLVDHNPSITVLPVDEHGNVYFVCQTRLGCECNLLELPAGVVEDGEDPAVCAMREIQEEIGLAARALTLLGDFYLAPGYLNEHMYVYLATDLYPSKMKQDEDEWIEIVKIPVDDVFGMTQRGAIKDAKTLATLLLATPHLSKIQQKGNPKLLE
jgi:ADP-ribose pyrophosphatase